jgi:hypothetical protein
VFVCTLFFAHRDSTILVLCEVSMTPLLPITLSFQFDERGRCRCAIMAFRILHDMTRNASMFFDARV